MRRMKLEEETSKLVIDDQMVSSDHGGATAGNDAASAAAKPKRVRTGCLTCRERHLKCDEGVPNCQNCKKSSRVCKRGVRLNFIDTRVEDPQIIPPTADWNVGFQDESREIASEYKGGAGRYGPMRTDTEAVDVMKGDYGVGALAAMPPAPMMAHQPLPPIHTPPSAGPYPGQYAQLDDTGQGIRHQHTHSNGSSTHSSHTLYPPSHSPYGGSDHTMATQNGLENHCLVSAEETLFMQVFVEEVGLWMDSMDPHKHFSRILPFYALSEPMLLNAFLACGARHLALVNPAYQEDKALHYYDTATRLLLKSLQNPNRDTIICATAAVILNVYEIMSERALQRMNHIAGARALIKECGWSARSVGIGAACFWLNVGMELLSCLHFNWQVAWNPDDWGVDMDMTKELRAGQEEQWTYKIVYITAKAANFRASIPRFTDSNPTAQAMRLQDRCKQWNRIKEQCDTWNSNIPRTMHPAAILQPHQLTQIKSNFPEVWLIKRTTITARLFYHTNMCLLPQMHPTMRLETPEMYEMQMHHARQICGIVAHVKDRRVDLDVGVASVALRCVAIAAECLVDYDEQTEILKILEKVKKETGWRIDFLAPELKKKWGWDSDYLRQQQQQQQMQSLMQTTPMDYGYQQPVTSLPPAPPPPAAPAIPRGIVNPLMKTADFNAPIHPYQEQYVPPNHITPNDVNYFYRPADTHYH